MTFDPRAKLIQGLKDYNNSRARTNQVAIGPSSLGDCRRKVYHQILQTPQTNPDTEVLASLLGGFIHTAIEERIMTLADDPFNPSFLYEIEVELDGMPGHVDFYDVESKTVVDWKTTQRKNLKDFPSQSNIWQVQNYARMLIASGRPVERVAVVVIPRDGRMDEIAQYIADYSEETALEGLRWLAEVKEMVAKKEKPFPERSARQFCGNYCPFYDPTAEIGCPGK
jgi:hypothetical protein